VPALAAAGWSRDQIVEQRAFTAGRIVPSDRRHHRLEGSRADYLLEIEPDFPLAVVEAKREFKLPGDGLQQAMRYAEILGLPLAYSTNGVGIVEHSFVTGHQASRDGFPSPGEAWTAYRAWRALSDPAAEGVRTPFNRELRNAEGGVKRPRYYQTIAINRIVEGLLSGRRRLLITMATGTGKTFVSLQVVWKLARRTWPGGRPPRILYLADRKVLIDQPLEREFRPVFGDAVWRIRGTARTGRQIYFALYQSLAGGTGQMFSHYPRDFFDLIIVDECHRGSAADESTWREILEYFEPAAQLGMTATPLRRDNVDTYAYFGDPVYEYSLAQGIDDGFLAPYRVHRIALSADLYGWSPEPGELDRFGREIPAGLYGTGDFERVVSLLDRTRLVAEHLTSRLRKTDRYAKTIVFCVDQEHAEQMRQALHDANADMTRQHPHYVARIVSDEGDIGLEHLASFVDPESSTPVIVTTSRLLTTGIDIPTCRNIVLFRPIGSMVEFKQIIGRGTRLATEHDKLSFEIIDYVGATALFADPAFDGIAEAISVEELSGSGAPDEPDGGVDPASGTGELVNTEALPLVRDPRKLYVDDSDALIAGEALYVADPASGRLRIASYREYSAAQVRELFPRPEDLRSAWRTQHGRDEVVAALAERGVEVGDLATRTGAVEADPFDLLVHIAWNLPMITRRERASRLSTEDRAFLDGFRPEAREVLEALLDKYAQFGISQLDDLASLEVPPLNAFGTPVEIARRFGGVDGLRLTVEAIASRLYAA